MSGILKPDGLRGIAMSELRCDLLLHLGRAVAQAIGRNADHQPVIYLCHDPRRSAEPLEAALCAGICTGGGIAKCLGVLHPGAMALLMTAEDADCGIALSADDAPYEINAVRLFAKGGLPMTRDRLDAIASLMPASAALPAKSHRNCGTITHEPDAAARWLRLAGMRLNVPQENPERRLRIAVDCAHGAASPSAELFFRQLNAEVLMLHRTPDGMNINRGGVCHTDSLAEVVRAQYCDAGFAFDGSCGRVIAVDETGELIDGSRQLAIFCQAMLDDAQSPQSAELLLSGAVTGDRTNLGFLRYAREHSIPLTQTQTAPRAVMEMMRERSALIGFDGVGCICFPDLPAPDGMMTAARLLRIMQRTGRTLSALAEVMEPAPQVTVPVPIAPQWREIWRNDPEIYGYIKECRTALGAKGRLMIREHPREPLLTVTLEGSDFMRINELALVLGENISLTAGGSSGESPRALI
ncbi:MAG: hypothetical protein K6E36_00650 [Oscillospiraceae bacterium]|nr:hypothetical protein [Oscillospiraceae bacterium]MCR5304997.1 hypothetical protein [Oscillospiraceae bacterium]